MLLDTEMNILNEWRTKYYLFYSNFPKHDERIWKSLPLLSIWHHNPQLWMHPLFASVHLICWCSSMKYVFWVLTFPSIQLGQWPLKCPSTRDVNWTCRKGLLMEVDCNITYVQYGVAYMLGWSKLGGFLSFPISEVKWSQDYCGLPVSQY